MKNTIMKNLKLIKKQDFGQTEYSSIGQETLTTQHYFTLEQKDGYILDAKIVKVVTDCGKTYYKVWSLKNSTMPFDYTTFKNYDDLIDMYSRWADDIKNSTLITQAI
jgi:hypothetical protein